MSQSDSTTEQRVALLEDEMAALERKVESLREEIRALAHLVDRGDIATPETAR